jgi:ArsR family metal-binding transcriptional regulator
MLLRGYRKEIMRPECNPNFQSLHCIAHLDQDVSEALPYLNASLGGFEYVANPPSVTFKAYGKLITVHGRRIAVNALKEASEAAKILEWLMKEINETWERRESITPCFEGRPTPGIMEILKLLPKTNCGLCGQPTCMVFAVRVGEGAKDADDCPALDGQEQKALKQYLEQFDLEQ